MCEYCGEKMERTARAVANPDRMRWFGEVVYVSVTLCRRCRREPSLVCPRCRYRTEPCTLCVLQQCQCRDLTTSARVHYVGGERSIPKLNDSEEREVERVYLDDARRIERESRQRGRMVLP